jgi:Ca2+-binding RTX toxin-like protein
MINFILKAGFSKIYIIFGSRFHSFLNLQGKYEKIYIILYAIYYTEMPKTHSQCRVKQFVPIIIIFLTLFLTTGIISDTSRIWADTINCQANVPCRGTENSDVITGTNNVDNIFALGGDDVVNGQGGNDIIKGGTGDDIEGVSAGLSGGTGDDQIEGNEGNDRLIGNEGNDLLVGNQGDDHAVGNDGNDIIKGNAGDDFLIGSKGNDKLSGGPDNDRVEGDDGNDIANGDNGNDFVRCDPNSGDLCTLIGGNGDDILFKGGQGKVIFNCGGGFDRVLNAEDGDTISNNCELVNKPEICDNGIDDDQDGFIDREDSDCQ